MASTPNTAPPKSIANRLSALHILVVEDNAVIAMLLATTLADMGHHVCAIEATEDGAVAAALHKPDLLIVDARLSTGGGVSAVRRILRSGFVPHVFVSGDEIRPEALDPRAIRLSKPYDDRALSAAIQRALAAPAAV